MSFINNIVKRLLGRVDNDDEVAVARALGVKIGDGCNINDNASRVFSTEPYMVTIGNKVTIAPEVRFITHDGAIGVLRVNDEYKNKDIISPIEIGNNVFIGIRTIIMPGVKIGDNVIIGAQSVVTKNIPDNSVAVGSPAKVICSLDEYKAKLSSSNKPIMPTKGMTAEEKKEYIMNNYPEWF